MKWVLHNQGEPARWAQVEWLNDTFAIVRVGKREEKVFRGASTGHWFATFNGSSLEWRNKRAALRYALTGKL